MKFCLYQTILVIHIRKINSKRKRKLHMLYPPNALSIYFYKTNIGKSAFFPPLDAFNGNVYEKTYRV